MLGLYGFGYMILHLSRLTDFIPVINFLVDKLDLMKVLNELMTYYSNFRYCLYNNVLSIVVAVNWAV